MKEEVKRLPKAGCVNCAPACCQDIYIIFNDDEVDIVRYGRYDTEEDPIDRAVAVPITNLEYIGRPETGRDTRATYKMHGLCGHATEVVDERTGVKFLGCDLHGTPDQPLVCDSGFPEGGYGCMKRREFFFSKQRGE